jgi:hypothetical protein
VKVIPFPSGGSASPDEAWLAELEAALDGESRGASADSWRELREDVRALAPPMDPAFERQLRARIAERGARSAPNPAPKQPQRRLGWLRRPSRPAVAAIATGLTGLAVVIAIAGSSLSSPSREAIPAPVSNAGRADGEPPRTAMGTVRAAKSAPAESAASASAGAASSAPASTPAAGDAGSAPAGAASSAPASTLAIGGADSAPGRVQQLGASITLTATPSDVQETADRVGRLAVSDGGFVQSSRVNVEQDAGEATIELSLPSQKLSGALAALGQLAPVHAESQSLQDITNTYNAAAQRLADATAERQALLHALSQASTEGQIDSLRERLSQNQGRIAQTRSALQTVSRHASTAEVEVTVVGDAHAGSEGLTLHRGLHDAGRVLVVTLVVLLIAAAILVPLALLLLALVTARRAWLRYRRERVLDAP